MSSPPAPSDVRARLPFLAPLLAVLALCAFRPGVAGAQISENVELLSNLQNYDYHSDVWGYASGGVELAIVGTRDGTTIVNATDPRNPVEIAYYPGPTSIWRDMKTYGHYLYIGTEGGGGLQIVDLADPLAPVFLGSYDAAFSSSHNIFVEEATGHLYALGTDHGMRILDLGDPENPSLLASFTDFYVHDIYVENGLAFAAAISNGELAVLDVSNLPAITVLSRVATPSGACHNTWLTKDGRYCLTTDETTAGHVAVFDVQDPTMPELVAQWFNPSEPNASVHNAFVRGDFAHISWYKAGYQVLDLHDPLNPVRAGYYDTFDGPGTYAGAWGCYPFQPSGVTYLSDMQTGLYIFKFSTSVLEGTVTEPGADGALGGVTVRTADGAKSTTTASDGTYLLYVEGGTQDFVYQRFGYGSDTLTIAVPETTTVHQDVELSPLPSGGIAGVVRNLDGGSSLGGVRVTVEGTPLIAVSDSGDGSYAFPAVPEGQYVVRAEKIGYQEVEGTARVRVDATYHADFNLPGGVVGDDFEQAGGWTVGAPDDDATEGFWVRVDPNGTIGGTVQPEDDHTPDPGVTAYVTGQGFFGAPAGQSDVDGGKTTLLSPIVDLTGMTDPVLRYYRWYSNDAGPNPGEDVFTVDVSDNGGASWVNLESLGETHNFWEEMTFDLGAYIALTDQVQVRFVASDYLGSSIVEAALDDVEIVEGGAATSVASDPDIPLSTGSTRLLLSGSPNPFRGETALRFRLDHAAPVLLDIFDVGGRRVKRLVAEETFEAGAHVVRWDGRDEAGRPGAPGMYLARLLVPGRTVTEKLMLAR